jgi:acylphosphatase
MAEMSTAIRLIIHGRVQGVGYRAWARREATRLGLDGWVRNRGDGTVELVAAGTAENLLAFVGLCERGPPAARVTAMQRFDAGDVAETGFAERHTV